MPHSLVRLGETQQMPFGRQDLPEPITKRSPQILGLAGFLRDD